MSTRRSLQTHRSIAPVAALLLLCFLWAFAALQPDLLPQLQTVRPLQLQFALEALTLSVVSIAASATVLMHGPGWPEVETARACVAAGLGLFVVPALLIHFSGDRIPEFTRVAIFSLVPVFTVVFEPHIRRDLATRSNHSMTAALVAVAGTLCIFPIDLPGSLEAGLAFGALVLASACAAAGNCWAVRAVRESAGTSIAPFTAIMGITSAVCLAGASVLAERHTWSWQHIRTGVAWSALVELPGLVLLFWLMPRMTATRMSTRFLIAPLIASLAGLIVLRARVGIRDGLGLLLIAVGAGWLLFAKEDEPEVTGSLLNS